MRTREVSPAILSSADEFCSGRRRRRGLDRDPRRGTRQPSCRISGVQGTSSVSHVVPILSYRRRRRRRSSRSVTISQPSVAPPGSPSLPRPCSEKIKPRLPEHGTQTRVQNRGDVSLGFPKSQRHRHPLRKSIFLPRISLWGAASSGAGVRPRRAGFLLRQTPLAASAAQSNHRTRTLHSGLFTLLSLSFPKHLTSNEEKVKPETQYRIARRK